MSVRDSLVIALVAIVVVGQLAALIITLLKGKWRLGLGMWIIGLGIFVLPVTAIRLAYPTSWWGRRFYSGEKLEESWRRFGQRIQRAKERRAAVLAQGEEYARQKRERAGRAGQVRGHRQERGTQRSG
jgi:hypothetical protein